MLCAFKRHFSGFWSNADSVSIMDALDFNRSATEYSFDVNEHDSVDLGTTVHEIGRAHV